MNDSCLCGISGVTAIDIIRRSDRFGSPKVGAKLGGEILAYENDEDDLLVSVLFAYAKLAGCPIDNLIYDHLEVSLRDLSLV